MNLDDQLLFTALKIFCCLFFIFGFCHDFVSAARRILLGEDHEEKEIDSNKKSI